MFSSDVRNSWDEDFSDPSTLCVRPGGLLHSDSRQVLDGSSGAVWSANDDLMPYDPHHDFQGLEQAELHPQSSNDLTCLPPSCFIKSGWTTEEPTTAFDTDWQDMDDPLGSFNMLSGAMDSFQSCCFSHAGENSNTIFKNSPESYLEYLPNVSGTGAEGENFDSLFDFDSFTDAAEQRGTRNEEGLDKQDKIAGASITPLSTCSETFTSADLHSAYASAFGQTIAPRTSSPGGKYPDNSGTDLQPSAPSSLPQARLPSGKDSPEWSHRSMMEPPSPSRVTLAASDIVERYGRPGPPDVDWMIDLTRRAQERSISSWTAMNL